MAKVIDDSGFWSIKDNPISKEGVFPYLGRNISPELDPDKIYMVYRPIEELSADETITSFNGVPFIDNHEMIGEGFTPYDERPAGGVLMNPRTENGVMYGDFKIYSEDLKEKILNGKKELSLGYLCDYEVKRGVWNGKPYDAIQKHLRGNHIALVENARMGKDCRVYDSKIFATDSFSFDADDKDVQWITTKTGAHIPLKEGQSKGEAVREFFKNKSSEEKKEKERSQRLEAQERRERSDREQQKKAEQHSSEAKSGFKKDEGGSSYSREYENGVVVSIEKDKDKDGNTVFNANYYNDKTGESGIKSYYTTSIEEAFEKSNKDFSGKDSNIPEKQDNPEKSGLDSSLTYKGEDEMADKREAIREVMAIAAKPNSDFEGGETEKIETIAKILEKSEYSKSEAGTANDEEEKEDKKAEDKCGKDEDDDKSDDKDDDKKSEAEDEDDKDEDDKKKAMDSMSREVLRMIARRNEIVKAVEPLIGSFACDEMTDVDASVYACKKLGLQVSKDEAPLVLKGYLTATKSNNKKVYGLDSADFDNGIDKATEKYLKGE